MIECIRIAVLGVFQAKEVPVVTDLTDGIQSNLLGAGGADLRPGRREKTRQRRRVGSRGGSGAGQIGSGAVDQIG